MDISDSDKQSGQEGGRTFVSVRFKVRGYMRFLSHAETMRVFHRACARAGIRISHSEGFNPHPRMSLVLPRSVGVESDDELLWMRLEGDCAGFDIESLKKEMPAGIEIVSAELNQAKKGPDPVMVRYRMNVKNEARKARIKEIIEELAAKEKIIVERRIGEGPETKMTDVRAFLRSISEEEDIFVDCAISHSGTIRVEEILDLLELGTDDLAMPVRRVSIQYKN